MNVTTLSVEQMIDEQREFFDSGVTKEISFRKAQLQFLKETIKKYEPDVLEALKLDLNKSEFEAYSNEIGIVYDSISYFLKHIDAWMEPEKLKTPLHFQPAKSYVVHEPYGVTCIIGPFNYPFQLVMEPLIGAIIGGNTAIVKPSEQSVHTCAIVKRIIEETFDTRFVRVVEGEKELVQELIHAPFDFIFFTGSVAVGKIVAKAAAERLTPITLELGGKSPAIVDQTANLDVAAHRIAWGKFNNAGQTCVAPDYVLVHQSVYPKFIKLIKKTIQEFYGKEAQKSPDFGRIINERQFNRLKGLLEVEKSNITFGGQTDVNDFYIEPTIVEGVDWNSPIMEDEIFGPILPIMAYDDLPRVISKVKRLPKPLAGYLFSENEAAIEYFLHNLPFGGGCINDTVTHVGNTHLPFGGVGPSGVGNYHGQSSFECFTHAKSIMHRSSKLANSLLYPPYKEKVKLVRTIMK